MAGVELNADSVVAESGEPEADALDAFDQIVDGLGGTVADVSLMPSSDLVTPMDNWQCNYTKTSESFVTWNRGSSYRRFFAH